jgi:hypothetical protein
MILIASIALVVGGVVVMNIMLGGTPKFGREMAGIGRFADTAEAILLGLFLGLGYD